MTWFFEIKKKKLFLLAKPFIIKVTPNNQKRGFYAKTQFLLFLVYQQQ